MIKDLKQRLEAKRDELSEDMPHSLQRAGFCCGFNSLLEHVLQLECELGQYLYVNESSALAKLSDFAKNDGTTIKTKEGEA